MVAFWLGGGPTTDALAAAGDGGGLRADQHDCLYRFDGSRDVVDPTERAAEAGVEVARAAAADQAATNEIARRKDAGEMEEAADRERRGAVSWVWFTVTVVDGPGGGLAGGRLVVDVHNQSRQNITSVMLLVSHGAAMREVWSPASVVEVGTTTPIPGCTRVSFEVPLDLRLAVLGSAYAWHVLMPDDPSLVIMQGRMVWMLRPGGVPAIAEDSTDFPRAQLAEAKTVGSITYSSPPTKAC